MLNSGKARGEGRQKGWRRNTGIRGREGAKKEEIRGKRGG